MNVQMYVSRTNFDVQKAQRFFKERRVAVQVMDLKKHRLGRRELEAFAAALGAQNLIDRQDKRVREDPACYLNKDDLLLDAILEKPWLLRSPLLRNGKSVTVGCCPQVWEEWLKTP